MTVDAIYDVVVVGAGPAGLGVAYGLRDLDLNIHVLEADDEVGGRTRSVQLAGAAVNTGAMFIYRGTRAETLARELAQETLPFLPRTYGVHIDGVTSVAGSNTEVVQGLPLPPESKTALVEFMDRLAEEYSANVSDGAITLPRRNLPTKQLPPGWKGIRDLPVASSKLLCGAARWAMQRSCRQNTPFAISQATLPMNAITACTRSRACKPCRVPLQTTWGPGQQSAQVCQFVWSANGTACLRFPQAAGSGRGSTAPAMW